MRETTLWKRLCCSSNDGVIPSVGGGFAGEFAGEFASGVGDNILLTIPVASLTMSVIRDMFAVALTAASERLLPKGCAVATCVVGAATCVLGSVGLSVVAATCVVGAVICVVVGAVTCDGLSVAVGGVCLSIAGGVVAVAIASAAAATSVAFVAVGTATCDGLSVVVGGVAGIVAAGGVCVSASRGMTDNSRNGATAASQRATAASPIFPGCEMHTRQESGVKTEEKKMKKTSKKTVETMCIAYAI